MAGGLNVSVRQIASYPGLTPATVAPSDLVLVQQGGMGGPYAAPSAYNLITGVLAEGGPLGVGITPDPNTFSSQVLSLAYTLPPAGALFWNAYVDNQDVWRYLDNGPAGVIAGGNGFVFAYAPPGQAGAPTMPPGTAAFPVNLMTLSPAGALALPHGTLTVARDPGSAMEVATMQWVGNQTVASFNGRRGVVTLSAADIACALGYPAECIATLPQVDAAICRAIQDLIHTYPAVWSWNGRVGDIWLNVNDINWALGQPGAPPILIPTPPADATDSEGVNAEWVINYINNVAGFATEAWVTQQITQAMANTVTSFNGRQGVVSLSLADVTTIGGAPIASPNFIGIPTAPTANPGTSTAQLATTAFVMNTIVALTPGVVSFNTRAGAVVLTAADINNAGGALLQSPNFTGTPAAPTAPNGTATSQIATTAFVMAEIAATTAGVVSFNGRSGVVTLVTADITAAGGAPNASPALTGIPTAPTAPNGTSSTQLATTAFVMNEINAINAGVLTFNGRSGTVSLTQNDVTAVGGLVNPSPQLTGTPTAPTPAPTDNSTNIATTAFVHAALANVTGGAVVTAVTPPTPTTGMLWWNTNDGQLYVWTGSTWVVAVNPPQPNLALYMPLAGGTFSGPVTMAGDATTALQPTTLQQVNAALGGYLPLSGGTLTGPVRMATNAASLTMATATASITGGAIVFPNTVSGTNNFQLFSNVANPPMIGINTGGVYLWSVNSSGDTACRGATFTGNIVVQGNANVATFNSGSSTISTVTVTGWVNVGGTPAWAQGATALLQAQNASGIGAAFFTAALGGSRAMIARVDRTDNSLVSWFFGGSVVGNVNTDTVGVTYGSNSDDRLKINPEPIGDAGNLIDALAPITYNWASAPDLPLSYGFSAQATHAVFPSAVTVGTGNPGDEGFIPWGMDLSRLVPLLVAAVKALRARVAALEANANLSPAVPVAA